MKQFWPIKQETLGGFEQKTVFIKLPDWSSFSSWDYLLRCTDFCLKTWTLSCTGILLALVTVFFWDKYLCFTRYITFIWSDNYLAYRGFTLHKNRVSSELPFHLQSFFNRLNELPYRAWLSKIPTKLTVQIPYSINSQ